MNAGEMQTQINDAEAKRQAMILAAEGEKRAVILASEAAKQDQINRAIGEAEAILAKQQATAKGLAMIAETLNIDGVEATSYDVAVQNIGAFGNIAKEGTTMLLPSDNSHIASSTSQVLALYKNLIGKNGVAS